MQYKVKLMARIYCVLWNGTKPSAKEKGECGNFRRYQMQASRSCLPKETHGTNLIPSATSCHTSLKCRSLGKLIRALVYRVLLRSGLVSRLGFISSKISNSQKVCRRTLFCTSCWDTVTCSCQRRK